MSKPSSLSEDPRAFVGLEVYSYTTDRNYRIESMIGEGGFGAVYHGRDLDSDEAVAVKIFLRTEMDMEGMWLEEARNQIRAAHPSVVEIKDCFEAGGYFFIMIEPALGSLLDCLSDGSYYALDFTIQTLYEVAWVLQNLHATGIVHGDVTINNLLIFDDGKVKLADFGLALKMPSDRDAGMARGFNPSFPIPEMLETGQITPQSDLYQLGLLGFTMLTGKAPLNADLQHGRVQKLIGLGVHREQAQQLASHGVPFGLIAVLRKLLERDLGSRYAKAAEVIEDLGFVARDLGVELRQPGGEEARSDDLPFRPARKPLDRKDTVARLLLASEPRGAVMSRDAESPEVDARGDPGRGKPDLPGDLHGELLSRLRDLRQVARHQPRLLNRIDDLEKQSGRFFEMANQYSEVADERTPPELAEFLDLFDRTAVDILQEIHLREVGGQG